MEGSRSANRVFKLTTTNGYERECGVFEVVVKARNGLAS